MRNPIFLLFVIFNSLIYSTSLIAQKTLNIFYISGSVNDKIPELRMSEKLYDYFSGLRKQLKNEPVFAYFNNKNKPITVLNFKDLAFRPFFDAINDSSCKEKPTYKTVNYTFRYFLYKQENSHAFDNINFHFFMSNNAMENIASDPEAMVYSLPSEFVQVLGAQYAQVTVLFYYDKSNPNISLEEIGSRCRFYKTNENISFQFKPL